MDGHRLVNGAHPGRDRRAWLQAASLLLVVLLAACREAPNPAAQTPSPADTSPLPPPQVYTPTQAPTATLAPTPTEFVPTPTPTPNPYAAYGIEALAGRPYGGGEIRVHQTLEDNAYFTRYLISYPSDGLEIYGFANVPKLGEPPYPVVIALHGYITPSIYNTLDYTTGYADALAVAGFLVLHPNLRGFPPSDEGENLFRVGMAVDVLNLIALVREWGGQEGLLASADPGAIGLWGHSMGGGISTRVITVDAGIRAAVLYGAMSGDERKNFERIFQFFSDGTRGLDELAVPTEALGPISPVNFLDRIQAAVSIHHGEIDQEVPLEWAQDTCTRLQALQKEVECFTYSGQPHTFRGAGNELFIQRTIEFFTKHLKPAPGP